MADRNEEIVASVGSMSFGQIWTLRDGLVERIDVLEPNDALEAAGLRETGSHAEPE